VQYRRYCCHPPADAAFGITYVVIAIRQLDNFYLDYRSDKQAIVPGSPV